MFQASLCFDVKIRRPTFEDRRLQPMVSFNTKQYCIPKQLIRSTVHVQQSVANSFQVALLDACWWINIMIVASGVAKILFWLSKQLQNHPFSLVW